MFSPAVKALKAKLQTKAKHRPHKMVKKKLPDGSGAIAVLPRRGSGRDAAALDDEYCAAVESCAAVFGRNKRSETTAAEHKMYMRLFDGWLVRSGFGSYVTVKLDEHGVLVAVSARRSAETKKIKVVRPQMLIGWLLDMVNGSENAPKGTHAGELAARAMLEAATACGRRVDFKRRKGAYGFGPYADEPWSLQAFQKRVYAVRDFYGVELRGTAVENPK